MSTECTLYRKRFGSFWRKRGKEKRNANAQRERKIRREEKMTIWILLYGKELKVNALGGISQFCLQLIQLHCCCHGTSCRRASLPQNSWRPVPRFEKISKSTLIFK